LTGEISSLKHNILDLQDFIAAERGPRLDALRQLETDLRDKEHEMARQLAESKNASNDAIQAEAKLLNEAITSERDDLFQWKQEAEHRLKELRLKVEELTSQLTALQCRCNEQENTIKEKADLVKDLEHSVKSKKFALSRYEEDMIAASKEIVVLKSKCEDLDALSNTPCDSDRVSKLEEWKREAEITLESNRKHIELLLSEKENLQSKMKEFVLQEQSLASQLSSIHDEKIALAKSSLEMAEAYEEKIQSLQDDASRLNELAKELEKQKCKYEDAQMAIKSLEMALVVSSCIFCYFIELSI
jgi:chromosome segregation ATPase